MQTPKITDILNKETLSVYEAARLVEAVADALKRVGRDAAFTSEDITEQTARLVGLMGELGTQYEAAWVKLAEYDKAAEKAADDLYTRQRVFRDGLIARIEALPKLPAVDVPYGIERLVTIAKDLSHLTDRQWARMIDLARALAEKGGQDDGA